MKTVTLFYFLFFVCLPFWAQEKGEKDVSPPDWNMLMLDKNANFYLIKKQVVNYFEMHPPSTNEFKEEGEGERLSYTNFQRWDEFWSRKVATNDPKTNGLFSNVALAYSTFASSPVCPSAGPYMATWDLLGPTNMPTQTMGLICSFEQHPTNPLILYAGSNNSGLWKTVDGGVNWVCKTDVLRNPVMGVLDIQIDPANPNTIYIATGSRAGFGIGVLKSTDGGNTWNPTGLSFTPNDQLNIEEIRMDPTNSNILYAITNTDLFTTTDAGATWTSILNYNSPCFIGMQLSDLELLPGNPNVVFVSSSGFVPCNGGAKMWKAELIGGTWTVTNITPPFTDAPQLIEIAVTPISPNTVYIVNNEFNTVSGSSPSYQNTYNNTTNTWAFPASLGVAVGFFDHQYEISPTDANVRYIGTSVTYKSTNGGAAWAQITAYNGATTHADIRAIKIISGSTAGTAGALDKVYIGNDGGVSKTVNGGTAWTNVNGNGLAITQFFGIGNSDLTPNVFPGGTQDNGAFTYNNGAWTGQIVGDAYDCEVDKVNPQYMYMLANGGSNSISRSTNGGASWGGMAYPTGASLTTRPILMHSIDNKLYTGYHDVFECANPRAASVTWTAISNFTGAPSGDAIRGLAVAPSDPNVIYASFSRNTWGSTNADLFYMTTNHGATWTDIGVNLGALYWYPLLDIVVDAYNPSKVWVTMGGINSIAGNNRVYFSGDGGLTWTDYSAGLPTVAVNTIVYEKGSNDGLYVGTDVGVFYRNASMAQWECFSYSLPVCLVYDLEINYAKNTIRAGTFGRGAWESNLACPQNYDLPLSGTTSTSYFYEAQNKITSTQQISGGTILYRGGQSVELNPGFSAVTSSYFSAYIHPCDVMGNSNLATRQTEANEEDNGDETSFVDFSETAEKMVIYPNPNEGKFTIDLDEANTNSTIIIYNLYGEVVAQFSNVNDLELEVDISSLSKGIYLVKCFDKNSVKTGEIICK